ncbi:pyridoxamine 5'-phosphate oxidase family protein, partial [Salinisphaera sp. T31B1]|uniref:FAD-binding oxidoreductase n=1 Tax=Salinisphaera sp. T31B1 TaxID=727963 RepID=UPI00333F3A03
SEALDADQRARIGAADTFFIGTGAGDIDDAPAAARGYDVSHRGGAPGFVRVTEQGGLQIPDYAGNNFFNTLGNLIRNPRVGLLFVDFQTGGMLQLTGRARIDWTPRNPHDPNARRLIEVTVDRVVDRPGALALRWHRPAGAPMRLAVVDKVIESDRITSFHLADPDSGALAPFDAGQHLPIELDIPDHTGRVGRSYSLSGSPSAGSYRLSIKREDHGLASRFLHDRVDIGDWIEARPPSGDFVLPGRPGPLVLVSAGVGITPMLAMLHAVVAGAAPVGHPVWFVHGTRNGAAHAFRSEVDGLIARSGRVTRRIFYSAPRDNDTLGVDYDAQGRVTAGDLLGLGAGPNANYLLCGPARFLADTSAGLEAGGVDSDRIAFETFGPAG